MEALEIIDALEELAEAAKSVPLMGKCMIDRDEVLDMLQDLRMKLPEELNQAKWVTNERHRIITEAQKEAAQILKGAEDKIISMINEHEITKKSYEQAREVEVNVKKRAREIKVGTDRYVDDKLAEAEVALEKVLTELRENRRMMRAQKKKKEEE